MVVYFLKPYLAGDTISKSISIIAYRKLVYIRLSVLLFIVVFIFDNLYYIDYFFDMTLMLSQF